MYLKAITEEDTVKTNVVVFRDNSFSHFIQRYLSNGHVYDKLLARKIDNNYKYLSNLPAVIMRALC
jgi:hypothetical protein